MPATFKSADSEPSHAVEEMQGLYGPYTVSERVLQKIWLRTDFRTTGLRTVSGKLLQIRNPGRWNMLEGPDFYGGEWDLDGFKTRGDVEIHFRARDWAAHGHDKDPRYAGVTLHVTLYPPEKGETPPRTLTGETPEQVSLLDRLSGDLEDYAAEEALLTAEGRDPLGPLEDFLRGTLAARRARVLEAAMRRWKQKLTFAAKRIAAAGWDEACHQLTLEALGYRRNRPPMSALATRHSLSEWVAGRTPKPAILLDEEKGKWKLTGLRPANHPRLRLEQYTRVVTGQPAWPTAWTKLSSEFPQSTQEVAHSAPFRKRHKLAVLRKHVAVDVFADVWHGARLDTLIGDVLMPLAAAKSGRDLFASWFHGYPGDAPEAYAKFLRQGEILDTRNQPLCHGLLQGALQIFAEGAG